MHKITADDVQPVLDALGEGNRRLLSAQTDREQEHALFVLRTHAATLAMFTAVRTPNERTDLFMAKLALLVPQLTDDELVGAYNVVNLPGHSADGEAWELVDAELRKRDIQVPGPYTTGDPTEVRRPTRCEDCDAEAALIYDTCGHGS